MVPSLDPLRVYIHDEGLVRICTHKYSTKYPYNRILTNISRKSTLKDRFKHLTNFSINKKSEKFVCNIDANDDQYGNKWSLKALRAKYKELGIDAEAVFKRIKDIIVKTLIVGQPYMSHIYRSCQPDDYDNSMCFQILGFDIMIDRNFKPWLIEVNQSPSFATDSPLDYEVKKQVLEAPVSSFRMP